jgi:acetylornithine deacetylase/succinyl-diaminopimelate desuccinylase-like protein
MQEDTARKRAGEPDMPSRDGAIARALAYYDDAEGYFRDLAARVAVPTESQRPEQLPQLYRYLREVIEPELATLGYACRIYDNPLEGCGPVLLAHRDEGAALTVLTYGHGDVVRGQEGEWENGRDPWALSFEGDRIYGRGVADNKGQHLAHQAAVSAVLAERGSLGFNHKIIIEMGEENGSRGFRQLVQAHKEDFAADVYFSSDGPRTEIGRPNITLGNRGVINFDLVCELRAGGHHSGNWGGLLANPGILLAQAIACITDAKGRILVDGWSPGPVPPNVRAALKGVRREAGASAPEIDPEWGEPGLTAMEKCTASNTFEVLAFQTGNPERPVNAIPPEARARCQLRFVVGADHANILIHLRRHLDAHGLERVKVETPDSSNAIFFEATRTDPDHPFARWAKAAVDRATGQDCAVLPNSGGSNVTEIMQYDLHMPTVWLPLSYAGCSQHAPNEHILAPLMRIGMETVSSVYWDLGDAELGYRP